MARRPAALALILVGCHAGAAKDGVVGGGDSEPATTPPTSGTTTAPGPEPTEVAAVDATPLGLDALSVNARIQPHGRPTRWWFEYGPTDAYGESTAPAWLGPKLGAGFRTSWDTGTEGWSGGLSGTLLEYVPTGGVTGGYVRYVLPGELDVNHADGIGANALAQYLLCGEPPGWTDVAALGGGDPDLRGARITASVRGESVAMGTAEIGFWAQSTPDLALALDPDLGRWSNWAYNGSFLTEGVLSGDWEPVGYTLEVDSNQWTYAGHYVASGRPTYVYQPLDGVLGHLNGDLFHMLVLFEYGTPPSGAIGFDDVEIVYRNESVLLPGNGGSLVASPAGDPAERLTDGWRNGPGRTWASAPAPTDPLCFDYALANPVAVDRIQLHQSPEHPARGFVAVLSSAGEAVSQWVGELPRSHPLGPNHAYQLHRLDPPVTADAVSVCVTSGWQADVWGLGEFEVFGAGAVMETDDDWYGVTADLTGQAAGATVHYRVVAESEAGTVYGPDQTFAVPADTSPWVRTGAVTAVGPGTARFEGRIDPLGVATNYHFEFGPDTDYGLRTGERYAGLELTPRTVTDRWEGMAAGTWHARLVAYNATGTTYGDDVVFVIP